MKIRSLLITAALAIAVVILVLQRSQITKLNAELQGRQATDSSTETPATTNPPSLATSASSEQSSELLRLRAEVTALRRQTNTLARLQAENTQLRTALATAGKAAAPPQEEPSSDAERAQAMARLGDSRIYSLALIMHLEDNQQRFATNMEELAPYLGPKGNPSLTGTNEFDIMLQGSREGITNTSGIILVREHQPRQRADGGWTRAYGFLDGHSEIHKEPTSNFDDYELQHLWPPRR